MRIELAIPTVSFARFGRYRRRDLLSPQYRCAEWFLQVVDSVGRHYDGSGGGHQPPPPTPHARVRTSRRRFKIAWNVPDEPKNALMHMTISATGIGQQGMIVSKG